MSVRRSFTGLTLTVPSLDQGFWPEKASHDTLVCQLANVPVGLSFHAQTCSV
jgi:hypothetical protein